MLSFSKNKLYNFILILTIILAIVLRVKTYFFIRPLWHDEASLAVNILSRNVFDFFTPLQYLQKAPPFFMSAVKIITNIFGAAELQLRLIPFLSSIGSIFLFLFLSKKVLFKKSSILIANFLFAINYYLIYYSQEFKQYSTDVFLVLASLLLFEKIALEKLTYKKVILCSFLSMILILFSFPMLFIVPAFITLSLIKANKETIKKLLCYILPIGIFGYFYYYSTLLPTKNLGQEMLNTYWGDGFLSLNIMSVFSLLKSNMAYYFHPNNITIIAILPMVIGIYILIKENKKLNNLIFLTLFFIVLGSLFHFYPLKERVGLYLFPIILLLIIKPVDLFSKKKKVLTLTVICSFLICFNQYNFNYFKMFFDKDLFAIQDSRTSMQIIAENYKSNDVFIYNQASDSDCNYYRQYFNFNPQKQVLIKPSKYDKKLYLKLLNNLPKNQTYWFYFPFDYKKRPVIEFVKEWLNTNHLNYKEFHYKRSHVLHIKL